MSLAIVLLHGGPAENSLGPFLSVPLRIACARIVNASPEDSGRKPQGDRYCHHLSVSLGLLISWHLSGCEWLPLQGKVNHVVSCCLHCPPPWSASEKQRKSFTPLLPRLLIAQANVLCPRLSPMRRFGPQGTWTHTWPGKAPEEERPLPAS